MNPDLLYDLAIIGGGINGAGIARDAAGRGLSVLLCEQDDLAAHTSSASTKLIHGGLRYLEYGEFALVRKALQEREVLLRAAPHLIRPLRFVLPYEAVPHQGMRPGWMIRLGLFFYDHLAHRERLPDSGAINLRRHPAGTVLQSRFSKGFTYSDAWVDDARLVVLNALDAQERGASIHTRTRCIGAARQGEYWNLQLQQRDGAGIQNIKARAVVNAAGPWVASVLGQILNVGSSHRIRLVKGSHIIVPKLFDHDCAYLFQNPDRRILFAIPYEHDYTLIGTTDVDYHDDPADVRITSEETTYLCAMANRYFQQAIGPQDVAHSYAGVRPLLDDHAGDKDVHAAAVTRDFLLELNTEVDGNGAPLLSVFGGKITTYRKLAEESMDLLLPVLGMEGRGHWTATAPLPGGDMAQADFDAFLHQFIMRYPFLSETPLPTPMQALALRLAHAYGTRALQVLGEAKALTDLGTAIAPGLYACELDYLRQHEWAQTAEDVLWRRSKLGLHFSVEDIEAVRRYLGN